MPIKACYCLEYSYETPIREIGALPDVGDEINFGYRPSDGGIDGYENCPGGGVYTTVKSRTYYQADGVWIIWLDLHESCYSEEGRVLMDPEDYLLLRQAGFSEMEDGCLDERRRAAE
jgi:hypothetical protein